MDYELVLVCQGLTVGVPGKKIKSDFSIRGALSGRMDREAGQAKLPTEVCGDQSEKVKGVQKRLHACDMFQGKKKGGGIGTARSQTSSGLAGA